MRVILDQDTPFRAAAILRENHWDAIHTKEVEMARAKDESIIKFAANENRLVVTCDGDFHMLLAKTRANQPSVVRMRIGELTALLFSDILLKGLPNRHEILAKGCAMSITQAGVRFRKLPLPGFGEA